MNVDSFIDTNIFIYAVGTTAEETWKTETAQALLLRERYAVSGQILAEFFHSTTKKAKQILTADQAREWVSDIAEAPVVAVDAALVKSAIDISQRYQTSYWDGAIIAAAERANAKVLYSEDLSHGQRYGDVTVVNPFLPQAH